jgi:hypothetical protein
MNNFSTKLRRSAMISVALFAMSPQVNAAPITLDFAMPDWLSNDQASIFGTKGVLSVTVQNLSGSLANQSYSAADIQAARFYAIGGTFDETWLAGQIFPGGGNLGLSYITTNSAGVPTLNLPSVLLGSGGFVNFIKDSTDTFMLWSWISPIGGASSFSVGYLNLSGSSLFASVSPFSNGEFVGFTVQGSARSNVPLPSSIALIALGLGLSYRRLSQQRDG